MLAATSDEVRIAISPSTWKLYVLVGMHEDVEST